MTERINLWSILIRPLFEMLIFPYRIEKDTINRKSAQKSNGPLKNFVSQKKNISNNIITNLMDFDLLKELKSFKNYRT